MKSLNVTPTSAWFVLLLLTKHFSHDDRFDGIELDVRREIEIFICMLIHLQQKQHRDWSACVVDRKKTLILTAYFPLLAF